MTDVVKDVIKGVQTSKQDVYKQKKEEFKGGNTKEEVSELRKLISQIKLYHILSKLKD